MIKLNVSIEVETLNVMNAFHDIIRRLETAQVLLNIVALVSILVNVHKVTLGRYFMESKVQQNFKLFDLMIFELDSPHTKILIFLKKKGSANNYFISNESSKSNSNLLVTDTEIYYQMPRTTWI